MQLDDRALWLVAIALIVAVIALFAWVAALARSHSALRTRLRAILGAKGEQGLDEVLDRILERVEGTEKRLDALNDLHRDLDGLLRRGTIRHVGVVRFNPFPDAGGDQSFAIALLDSEGSGLVLSSLHARTDTRVFAKPVQSGRSRYPLTDEELDAIKRALSPSQRVM